MKTRLIFTIVFVYFFSFLRIVNIYAEENLKFEKIKVFKDAIRIEVNKLNTEIFLYDEDGYFVSRKIVDENKKTTIYVNKYNNREKSKSKIIAKNGSEEIDISLDDESIKIRDCYYDTNHSINIKNEEKEVYPKNIKIDKNIISGNLENQEEEILKVYYLGEFLGEGYIKNNQFEIELLEDLDEDKILEFYIEDKNKKSELHRNFYVKGYEDGTFRGNNNLTRAEAIMMISRLINDSCDFDMPSVTKYKDAQKAWYSEAINFAESRGLIFGNEKELLFRPNESIKGQEFKDILENYIKNERNINDIDKNRIEKAINDLVKENSDKYITRYESVVVLNSAFGRISSKNSIKRAANISHMKVPRDIKDTDYYIDVVDAMNTHSSYRRSANDEVEIWTDISID